MSKKNFDHDNTFIYKHHSTMNMGIKTKNEDWSFNEEIELLDAMIICGPDNWEGIAKMIDNRSADECKKYYFDHFILKPKCNELISILENSHHKYNYMKNWSDSDDVYDKTEQLRKGTNNNILSDMLDTSNLLNNNNNNNNNNFDVKVKNKEMPCASGIIDCDRQNSDNCKQLNNDTLLDNNFYDSILPDIKSEYDDISYLDINADDNELIGLKKCDNNLNINFNNIGCNVLQFDFSDKNVDSVVNSTREHNDCDNFFNKNIVSEDYILEKNTFSNNCKLKVENFDEENFSLVSNFYCEKQKMRNLNCRSNSNLDIDMVSENKPEQILSGFIKQDEDNFAEGESCVCNNEDKTIEIETDVKIEQNRAEKMKNLNHTCNVCGSNQYCIYDNNYNLSNKNICCVENDEDKHIFIPKLMKDERCSEACSSLKTSINVTESKTAFSNVNRIIYNSVGQKSSDCFITEQSDSNTSKNEFDDKAEELLTVLRYNNNNSLMSSDVDDDSNLIMELSFSIVKSYNFRLSERIRRKRFICRYNLFQPITIFLWFNKCKSSIKENFKKNIMRFLQLMYPQQFDQLLKRFKKIYEIKRHFYRLLEYREQGMTRLSSVELYEDLKKVREDLSKKWKDVVSVTFFDKGLPVIASSSRKSAPPLSITHLPGYTKLDKTECDFCSVNRIVPESYLQFKDTIINDCKKRNGIKLAQARLLLKIDVNKTRKLFDFLLEKRLIWQSS
ncbi:uncharacterized protein LOC142328928 [Lycorma delicatula]|uniref:uncharacterized protein LOC142328928 n=1 Tax=Lycorma delicatula TaxID=130591 RepID=UPI003F515EE2